MSEQPGRYQRSTSGMVGALLVTLLVILAFVGFRALNRSDLDVKPEHVDYLAQVGYAQQAGADVVYPARLPSGWYATQVDVLARAARLELELSMLTGDGQYVGLVESPTSAPRAADDVRRPAPAGGCAGHRGRVGGEALGHLDRQRRRHRAGRPAWHGSSRSRCWCSAPCHGRARAAGVRSPPCHPGEGYGGCRAARSRGCDSSERRAVTRRDRAVVTSRPPRHPTGGSAPSASIAASRRLPGAVEPLLADRGELLAALPQRQALLERRAAGLERRGPPRSARRGPPRSPAVLASLVVLSVMALARSGRPRRRWSVAAIAAVGDPDAQRRRRRSTSPTEVDDRARRRPGPRRTPARSVASGDSARARARWWPMSSRGPVEAVVERAAAAVAQVVDLDGPGVEQAARVGQRGPGPQRRPAPAARGRPAAGPAPAAGRAPSSTPAQLLGHVGHQLLGGVGRRRGAHVGDQVEQRGVGLVADRGDHRRAGAGARPGPAPRRRTAAGPRPSRRRARPRSRRRSGRGRAGSSASITSAAARVPCIAAYAASKATAGPAAAGVLERRRARRRSPGR